MCYLYQRLKEAISDTKKTRKRLEKTLADIEKGTGMNENNLTKS
jgi:hypothetical protein